MCSCSFPGLTEYVPQSNNYVVFNRFWELCPSGGPGSQHKVSPHVGALI